MEDNGSHEEPQVEAEIRDLPSCVRAMESTVREIEDRLVTVREIEDRFVTTGREIEDRFATLRMEMQYISEMLQQQETMDMQTDQQADETADQPLTHEKLSQAAKELLDQEDRWPNRFKEFLLEESFGKPKPPVLPIVRKYAQSAHDIQIILSCLQDFKSSLRQRHANYMEDRRKDLNLQNRIKRLENNINRELDQERRGGGIQTSIDSYLTRNKNV